MKRLKKILLIIMLLTLSGCSADYNLIVTSNHKIKETVKLFMTSDELPEGKKNIKEHFDNQIKSYSDVDEFRGYGVTYKIAEDVSYIQLDKMHSSFADYQESAMYSNAFDDVFIHEDGEFVTFETVGRYLYSNLYAEPEMADPDFIMGDINVKIRLHNTVVENNADNFDEKNNTLEWKITSNDTEKSISFKVSQEKRYDIMIIDFFMLNKKIMIPIVSALVIGLSVGFYFYVRIRKNNSI